MNKVFEKCIKFVTLQIKKKEKGLFILVAFGHLLFGRWRIQICVR